MLFGVMIKWRVIPYVPLSYNKLRSRKRKLLSVSFHYLWDKEWLDSVHDIFAFLITFETCGCHWSFESKITPSMFICSFDVKILLFRFSWMSQVSILFKRHNSVLDLFTTNRESFSHLLIIWKSIFMLLIYLFESFLTRWN